MTTMELINELHLQAINHIRKMEWDKAALLVRASDIISNSSKKD